MSNEIHALIHQIVSEASTGTSPASAMTQKHQREREALKTKQTRERDALKKETWARYRPGLGKHDSALSKLSQKHKDERAALTQKHQQEKASVRKESRSMTEAPISPGGYWSNLPPEPDAPAASAPSIAPLQSKLARSGAVIGVFKGHLAVMTPVPNSAKGVNLEQLLTGQASVTARNNMRTVCAWLNARLAKVIPNFDPYSELALQPDVMCDVLPADATSAAKATDGLMLAWTTNRSMQSARQRKVEQMIIQQYKLPRLA